VSIQSPILLIHVTHKHQFGYFNINSHIIKFGK